MGKGKSSVDEREEEEGETLRGSEKGNEERKKRKEKEKGG